MAHKSFQLLFRTVVAAGICLIMALAGFGISQLNGAPPGAAVEDAQQAVVIPPKRTAATSAELRKRYPMVSLKKRLAYEAGDGDNHSGRPDVRLTEDSGKRLNDLEKHYGAKMHGTLRSESLKLLHSNQVEKFMTAEGFGMSRMVSLQPSPEHLEYPQPAPTLVLARSADDLVEQPAAAVTLPDEGVLEEAGGAWTPSRRILDDFRLQNELGFAAPWSLGYVKDRDHVAGFVPHGFGYVPEVYHPDNQRVPADPARGRGERETRSQRWKLGRLELVSLLKHGEPAVYVSENLPRMNNLDKTSTRALSEFEQQALQSLEDGEDLVAVAGVNDIYMLGAVRAVKQCTACHDARRGELLGAFSYRLRRSPLLKVPAPRTKPAA